ncbi:hypothetical protein DICPUDRAFT_48249 [Dictyostelium purpureum]|uniref:non-specific serine/threonine protein kinase n=1 Tax=Dictyostelium purpureum TaxID=5786 RepID=F0ZNE9_DICPU|nr:uncharacterized protein DICPUDRAFT_48249 [Dictyostelium purpureum]EGC34518.1 hypothetical protein DICPUDRAFT_48249 [Dictyostelium purpureum]|eukprot:XP_003288954.1 hypothetical protein DICPUDRAFT_48249 [Dictyostelium purpureum]
MEYIKEVDVGAFSKYQFGESVGKGAFGKVFKALNTETGDFCAIKQIEKGMISEKQLPAILHEIKLLQTLQHPNIVKFIESHETPRYLYFALEFIEGGSLAKITKRYGCFQEPLLSRYINQVLKGLAYLHDKGVIHRDIKGDNILITKEGVIKLADFGSCTYSAIDRKLTVVGTPFWMAPEVIQMDMNARSTACDIWSLGCTLLELLTGNPPYWDLGTMPAMFAMVNNQHPPIPQNISPDLKNFLMACFVRDINKRPTAAMLLEHPWIKLHYHESPEPKSKSGSKLSLSTYVDGYSDLESSEGETSADSEIDLKERIHILESQKKEMAETIKRLKVHFLRAMKEKKIMKDMIAQLVNERDSYMVKLGLTPPPLPTILTNTTSHTPTRAALEHANEMLSKEGSHLNLLSPNSPNSPHDSKHTRSSSAPLSAQAKIIAGHSPALSNASASASTGMMMNQNRERLPSSILTNDFFHPPEEGFDDGHSPSNDSFLNDHFEKNVKISSPSSLSKNSRHHTSTPDSHQSPTPIASSSSSSNQNLGGYYSSSSNLHMYSNINNNNNNNINNSNNVDMYLRTSGDKIQSPQSQPVSLSGALSFGENTGTQPIAIGGNSLKSKTNGKPVLQKELSNKSLNNSGISATASPSRKISNSDTHLSTTPPRKSSQPVAPSFSLLNQSLDRNISTSGTNGGTPNSNSNSIHDSADEYDEETDFIEDDPSNNNSSNNSSNSNTVPKVESVVVNVQPPRVGDECKVKCGDGWYDAIVDLVSGSTFVVTIKPFNIKREVSHSDVTLAPLQFPVIVTKKKKFSLFGKNKS